MSMDPGYVANFPGGNTARLSNGGSTFRIPSSTRHEYRMGPSLDAVASGQEQIRFGHAGEDVRRLQSLLNDAGIRPPLATDGLFGPRTQAALRRFQQRVGFTGSGTLNQRTLDRLQNPGEGDGFSRSRTPSGTPRRAPHVDRSSAPVGSLSAGRLQQLDDRQRDSRRTGRGSRTPAPSRRTPPPVDRSSGRPTPPPSPSRTPPPSTPSPGGTPPNPGGTPPNQPIRTGDARLDRRAERLRTRLGNDSLTVMHTTQPTNLQINGVNVPVHGANPQELETIRTSLSRLPASHLRTIPRIVVADTIANGNRTTGGNCIDEGRARQLNRGRLFGTLAQHGLPQQARLELSRESLTRARNGVSSTVLHETGHFVDNAYGLSRQIRPEQLGSIQYRGVNNPRGEPMGPVRERFANAYAQHYGRRGVRDPVARQTVDRVLATVPA